MSHTDYKQIIITQELNLYKNLSHKNLLASLASIIALRHERHERLGTTIKIRALQTFAGYHKYGNRTIMSYINNNLQHRENLDFLAKVYEGMRKDGIIGYAYATDYPKIFRDTYWSSGYGNDNTFTESIIGNRNKLVRDYNIIRPWVSKHIQVKLPNDIDDHKEMYITKDDGRLLVVSPYCSWSKVVCAQELGLHVYLPLYECSTPSFLFAAPSLLDYKCWAKRTISRENPVRYGRTSL